MQTAQNFADQIERAGFFPELTRILVKELVGDSQLLAGLVHHETCLDINLMQRHTTLLCLLPGQLGIIHVDELDTNASASTETIALRSIKNFMVTYGVANPSASDGGEIEELTLQIAWGAVYRSETDQFDCGDPNCQNVHGFNTQTIADDLLLRFSVAADGPEAVASARHFANRMRQELR